MLHRRALRGRLLRRRVLQSGAELILSRVGPGEKVLAWRFLSRTALCPTGQLLSESTRSASLPWVAVAERPRFERRRLFHDALSSGNECPHVSAGEGERSQQVIPGQKLTPHTTAFPLNTSTSSVHT